MVKLAVRRPATQLMFVSVLVLIFALAACGGSSNSGSSSGSSTSNSSGSSGSATTVTVKESKTNGQADVYTCSPDHITVKKGDKVTFTNTSDEKQDFDQGDAQKAGVDFVMDINQSTSAIFNTTGTFTIKSEKGATITVTVQ